MEYGPTNDHKGDPFTKESFSAEAFHKSRRKILQFNGRTEFERGDCVNMDSKPDFRRHF